MKKSLIFCLALVSFCFAQKSDSIFADLTADIIESFIQDHHLFEKDDSKPSVDSKYIHAILVALLEDFITKKDPIPEEAFLEVPE